MNDLYEVLEICLQEIEQGADIETVLFRYPDFADELRPILEGSMNARSMAIVAPSAEVVRRNRAKVLQHAAQMREAQVKPSRRIWFASLRRLVVTLAVVAVLFVSGTSLVRAASTTLPGDNLYPVKRSWEDVVLLFTFNLQQREALEIEHENERLHELRGLFEKGKSAEVEFAGLVSKINGTDWVIGGFPVVLSPQTEIDDGSIVVGSAVRVKGWTQGNGIILAERVRLLPPDAILPDEVEIEAENHEGTNQAGEDNSGKGSESEGETPNIEETKPPETESEPKNESFDGVVTSVESDSVTINDIVMDVSSAEIKGTPNVGAPAKVEGYYDANGIFIVTKIEFQNDGSGNGSGSNDGGTDSGGSNDNGSNDPSSGSGGDDSGGGGDNSGSGGGGDG